MKNLLSLVMLSVLFVSTGAASFAQNVSIGMKRIGTASDTESRYVLILNSGGDVDSRVLGSSEGYTPEELFLVAQKIESRTWIWGGGTAAYFSVALTAGKKLVRLAEKKIPNAGGLLMTVIIVGLGGHGFSKTMGTNNARIALTGKTVLGNSVALTNDREVRDAAAALESFLVDVRR